MEKCAIWVIGGGTWRRLRERGGTNTIDRVMTVGLGMYTIPTMLVPSASGVSSIWNDVTLKPASLFRPMYPLSVLMTFLT